MNHVKLSLYEFVYSALMHDIGKVMQRAEHTLSERFKDRAVSHQTHSSHQHACWTEEFLMSFPCGLIDEKKWQRIINLSASHHLDSVADEEDMNLLILLKSADRLASSFDRDVDLRQNFKQIPLYSVFQEIKTGDDKSVKYQYMYPFKTLMPDHIFPEKLEIKSRVKDYQSLFKQFSEDYQGLSQEWKDETDFKHFLNAVDYLMEKHFYSIPSNTQEEHPSNSLYHHSKTTALIAAVLYQKFNHYEGKLTLNQVMESDSYLLIGGDLSGIQSYLYDLNPENSQKGAKFLRARSFKVKALSDMVIFKIISECGLSHQNIVINAGGKFIILAPETDEIIQGLQKIQKESDALFYSEFLGSISLNLDWNTKIRLQDLHQNHLAITLKRLFDSLETQKQARFKSRLTAQSDSGVQWDPKSFIVNQEKITNDQLCPYCNRRKSDHSDSCHICSQEINLGKNLPKKHCVAIARSKQPNAMISLGDTALYLLCSDDISAFKNRMQKENTDYFIYFYKRTEKNKKLISRSIAFPYKATAAYIPTDEEGEIIDFEDLAGQSSIRWDNGKQSGLSANAIIKGDVDNLGTIFQKGILLKDDKLSLARYISCSSLIDFFFSEYIPYLLENESAEFNGKEIIFNTLYTVYTGGDDFCLIGPWLTVLLFANRLKQDFALFTCNNPEVHFSCGIELMHGKSPAKYFIEKTDEALEKAKKIKHTFKHKTVSKNSVFVFDTIVPWDEFDDMLNEAETYFRYLNTQNTKGYTTQFIYRMFQYHDSYMKVNYPEKSEKTDMRNYLYSALLAYDLKRNFKKEDPAYEKISKFIQFDNKTVKTDYFRLMKAINHIVIYANRSGKKGGENGLG